MKSQKFFFSIVAVLVILGVFLFFFFGIVKPRFQSEARGVNRVGMAVVNGVEGSSRLDRVVVGDIGLNQVAVVDNQVRGIEQRVNVV